MGGVGNTTKPQGDGKDVGSHGHGYGACPRLLPPPHCFGENTECYLGVGHQQSNGRGVGRSVVFQEADLHGHG